MDEAVATPTQAGHNRPRNPGVPLAPDWFESVGVNASAVERRAGTLTTRRSVKKEYQAAWLVKAMTCIDLTTLSGDDTPGRVRRLCAKARHPLGEELLAALDLADLGLTVAAICVYPTMVAPAVKALEGSGIPVASVATGFPTGLTPLKQRLDEIRYAVGEGAREIDIVITRAHVLGRDWSALYDEVAAMREVCGQAHLKTILGTGDLKTLRNVYAASMVAMQAGADFIKTSTGKEDVNATLPVSLVMIRALRDYRERAGVDIGFKPAGGLRTTKDALAWLILMKEELGLPWMQPDLFRIGASGLLTATRWREGKDGRHQGHPTHHGLWSVARRQRARQSVARRARRRLRALRQWRLHHAARPVRGLQSGDRRGNRARDAGLSGGCRRRGRRGAGGSSQMGSALRL